MLAIIATLCEKLENTMATFDADNDPLGNPEALERHIRKALEVQTPDDLEFEITYNIVKRFFKPRVLNAERLPDKPCLFIGNHSLFAVDGIVLLPVMQRDYGRFLRPLGDKFLFASDRTAKYIMSRGGTMGHPDVCHALMENGQDMLVFPGGAHEAVKSASEMYKLQWKERYGFIKLAAAHGYTIMPFGMVGPDEFYSHLIEGQDLPDSRVGWLLKRLGVLDENTRPDLMPPVPRGALGTLIPKPQACYIGFGEPVDLSAYEGKKLTKAQLKKLRGQVAQEIEEQLAELLLVREQNRKSDGLLRRILSI